MTITTPQSVFTGNHFRIRQKFSWFFRQYAVVEHRFGGVIGYARQEPFTLKTGVRLYQDEAATIELLYIKQRAILEWAANYDVIDSTTGQPLGNIRHAFWGSMTLKEWTVTNTLGQEIGSIAAPWSVSFSGKPYVLNFGPNQFGTAKVTFAPFAAKLDLDVSAIPPEKLDRRLAIAFGLLVIVTRLSSNRSM